jgi:hypothetical protein
LRRRLDDRNAAAVLRRVHVALVRRVRAGPGVAWDVVADGCSVRAKRGGEPTGPLRSAAPQACRPRQGRDQAPPRGLDRRPPVGRSLRGQHP